VPGFTGFSDEIVIVEVVPLVDAGLKLAEALLGTPLADSATAPVKPLRVMVIANVVLSP